MKKYLNESFKYLLRSKPLIKKEIEHVEYLYSLSDKDLERYNEQQFIALFQRAYTKSKFYHKFYSSHGIKFEDISSLTDIKKLPVLTKEMVKKNHKEMLTVPAWRVRKAKTSGTTGTPLTVYHSYKAIRLEQAYIWVCRKRYGFTFGEKVASLRGNLNRDEFKMYVPISNHLYLSSYNINKENAKKYYRELKNFKPKAIEGYPSSLYNLSLFLAELGLSLEIPLAFTSSETLFPFQREVIERVIGTEVYDHYGCTERTIFLSEKTDHVGYEEAPGYSINEYQENSILTTSLINHKFPLIRYQVNDMVETDKMKDIMSIEGRNNETVICKDGTLTNRLNQIFKDIKGVKFVQVVQKKQGEIKVHVSYEEGMSQQVIDIIMKNCENKFGKGNMQILIKEISEEDIIYTERGKFNLVKSYI